MTRRSLDKDLAAVSGWANEIGSAEGILGAERSGFEALAAERARQEGRRRFPTRDVAALGVRVSAAEARRADRRSEAEAVYTAAATATSVETIAVTAVCLGIAGVGVAIALPSAHARQIVLGTALAIISFVIIGLNGGAARWFQVYAARRACRRADRAVDKARVRLAAAQAHDAERERWVQDTTRLLLATHEFHRREAELAVHAATEHPFDEESAGEQLPH